jgi:hypothetical protein
MDWRLGLSRRVPALHVQSPELKKKKSISVYCFDSQAQGIVFEVL